MKIKILSELNLPFGSSKPEDYIDVLNKMSPQLGGLDNLGVFADITNIEISSELQAACVSEFVSIKIEGKENPGGEIFHDHSSQNPLDYNYDELLDGLPVLPPIPEINNFDKE